MQGSNGVGQQSQGYGIGAPFPYRNTRQNADDALAVTFYMHRTEAGKETPYVWIRFPGDKTREIKRPATDEQKRRFARQWEAFEAQQSQMLGTPLEAWPLITPQLADSLKERHVFTVEQLSMIPDTALQGIGLGARELRGKAIAWLDEQRGEIDRSQQLEAENAELRADLERLSQKVEELSRPRRVATKKRATKKRTAKKATNKRGKR